MSENNANNQPTDSADIRPDWSSLRLTKMHSRIVSGDHLRLGTIFEALGEEKAMELLNRPNPFKEARQSAARRFGSLAIGSA